MNVLKKIIRLLLAPIGAVFFIVVGGVCVFAWVVLLFFEWLATKPNYSKFDDVAEEFPEAFRMLRDCFLFRD